MPQRKHVISYDPRFPTSEVIMQSLERYVNEGIIPGSFLLAVLENDLQGACALADSTNQGNIFNIVGYITCHVPRIAWGSAERVDAWQMQMMETRKQERLAALNT